VAHDPAEFPKWGTVYSYFAKWSKPDREGVSALERALKKSVGEAREKLGRNATTSFIIVDAQSVKNTDSAEKKGYDAGKKISGIKRHIAVDTQGLPHAIAVTTADVTDRNGALAAIDRCKPNLHSVESMLVDGGYTGQPFADGVMERLRPRSKSSSAINCTPLPCCRNVGSSNAPSDGWKSAAVYGKTANEN